MSDGLVFRLIEKLPPADGTSELPRGLDEAKLAAVLGAARVAPSADNAQTWRFVTVQQAEMKARLGETIGGQLGEQVAASHTVIVLCGIQWVVTRARREQPFVFMDVPIALTHILLQAAELKLGCAWTMDVDESSVRDALHIPETTRVVALIGLS